MKKYPLILIMSLAALMLSSCRRGATPTPTATATEGSLSGVYTSVAATLTAQALSATPTLTPSPQATPTLMPSPSPSATSLPTQPVTQAAPTILPTSANVCNNSAYVSDVTIPDGTVVAPGQAFVKTWMLKNTGTCTWSNKYSLNFASGEKMGGTDTKIGQSVAPGGQVKISVSMIAPATEKTYTGYWRMANESGSTFGATVWVQIVVSKGAGTLTPTISVTPTTASGSTPTSTTAPAATKTPTTTTAPTNTSEPTSTETSSPTETPTP